MRINNISATPFKAGYIVQGRRTKKEVETFFDTEIDRIKQVKKTTVDTLNFLKTKEAQKLISALPEGDVVYLSTIVDDDVDADSAYPMLHYQANDTDSENKLTIACKYDYKVSPSIKITNGKNIETTITNWLKQIGKIVN